MRSFQKFILLAILFAFSACMKEGSSDAGKRAVEISNNIPKLLDRAEALHYGNEWTNVQNHYGKNKAKLIANPGDKEAWLNLAELFIQEARVTGEHPHYYPAALQVLDVMLSEKYNMGDIREQDLKFRGLTAKASVLLSQHEFAEALKTGEQALKLNPYNSGIYGVLVDANVELGRYPEAVAMADKMAEIRPDMRSYSRISYLREIHGDIPGSLEAMNMAVEACMPGTEQAAWTRLTLGKLLEHYGKSKEAEMQYQLILQERPDYPFALGALADLEIEKKNYAKAEELLDKAAAIIPEVGFYESLAKVYQATGRQTEFEKTVQDILSMMKEDEASGHNMDLEFAHVYSDLAGDHPKALEFALKVFEKRPENIDVNGVLAELYAKTGDPEKSKMHLGKALRTGSKKPEWLALR